MNLANKKRIAAGLLKAGRNRVWFDPDRLEEIKEAITKADFKRLIKDLAIQAKPVRGNSRFRIRKSIVQKRKGRKKGKGSRKGRRTARLPRKKEWIRKIRPQREFAKMLKEKEKISTRTYRQVYKKIKGDFFRSKRHIKLYLTERDLMINKKK